jgi:hypothetical protein
MTSDTLTETEKAIVRSCLRAVVDGPFFNDAEFSTLFGLTRNEIRLIADAYPNVDECDDDAGEPDDSWLAINNTFANLIGYPHKDMSRWAEFIPISHIALKALFTKWKK